MPTEPPKTVSRPPKLSLCTSVVLNVNLAAVLLELDLGANAGGD